MGGVVLLPKYLLGLLLSGLGAMELNVEREAHLVERWTGMLCCHLFLGAPILKGLEHLPQGDSSSSNNPAIIFIANHASQVDLAAVYFLRHRFKWISKSSVKYLPGVGLIMRLSNHVFLQRSGKNKKSVSSLYERSDEAIRSGVPMFFFPQGTRRMHERLPFKDGAFRVAGRRGSDLVPVSIEIPGDCWSSNWPLCLAWGGA